MADVKITDLVEQSTIDKIKELNTEMQNTLTTYTTVAKDLAKGIDIPVKGLDDLEKLQNLLVQKSKEAATSTEQLNRVVSEQREVIANTTNTISRQLMEQERVNKAQREAYTEHDRVKKLLEHFNDTYEGQLISMKKIEDELSKIKEAQKENAKSLKEGTMSIEDYNKAQLKLMADSRRLKQEKAQLNQIMTAEEKANLGVETSYQQMSQQLELLKKSYKGLSAEGRDSEFGRELEEVIQNLDAHLKDVAADMGEFQRNVGNYAIAGQNGIVTTESLMAALSQEANTVQDLIDQNKILEEGKARLNTADENYGATVAAINEKIDENKRKLLDVSDIIDKEAKSVAEAEEQNKRLKDALKNVDRSSEDAEQQVAQLTRKIEENTQFIEENTEAVEDNDDANKDLADNLLGLIGINANFGKSLTDLGNSGGASFIDGMNTKVRALGKTLMGLLANPWVLAFLGIAAVGMAVKWWYDYNKGLVEATKLTKDFTGLTGSELKGVRNEVQGVADAFDKDFREVLEAANAMSKQFGISVQEALHLMEDGFVAGADVNEEFLENIKEYPAYFKEAGISASEFVAITTQANQAGIYSDKGIDVIKEGNLRIREMTKATADALDAIGISSKQAMQDLADGSKTTFDIMQEVSAKLAEFPETSTEVGTALADIFGGPGEDAGLQYILTLKDIDTNLDNVKERAGELGALQEEQMRSQIELENVIASVFDQTGGSFETMTTKAKVFVNDGLIAIIKGCVDIVNWFIRLYNKSIAVRAIFESIVNSFKTLWAACKLVVNQIIDAFKALGDVVEGVFTLDYEKVQAGWSKGMAALKKNVGDFFSELSANSEEAMQNILNGQMEEVTLDVNTNYTATGTPPSGAPKGKTGYKVKQTDEEKKAAERAAKEAEKAAKEELKRIGELEDSKIALMAEGHDKQIALIRQKFKKKIDQITGDGETEKALRLQLAQECENEIAEFERKYQENLAKINLENRLATAKEGSKQELDLKLAQLEAQRQAELKAAEATGADVNLINEKFNQKREELEEKYAAGLADKVQQRYAAEELSRQGAFTKEANALQLKYAKEIALAKGNAAKQEELKQQLEDDLFKLSTKYSEESAQAAVDMIEEILKLENLSAEDRLKWEQELSRAKIAMSNQVTDNAVENAERQAAADDKLRDKRKENLDRWLNVASDVIGNISGLVNAIFDGQIEKIEAEQEANTEAGEAEQERISELVNKKVITEEEGEARKRAAEAQTAKKNEELEKKKAKLQRKQAIFQKATDVAQAGISTALAITNALTTSPFPLGLAMAAIAGAMGAVQIATILATPIPQYAKGTDYHKGGPAIVGDGGRPEVVMFNGGAWLTPDKPTLVDMPKGAVVIPSISEYDNNIGGMTVIHPMSESQVIMSGYDDKNMRRGVSELAYLIRQQTKQQRSIAYHQEYELFKNRI